MKVDGSSPSTPTIWECANVGELGQTVNLLPFGLDGSNPSTPTNNMFGSISGYVATFSRWNHGFESRAEYLP